MRPQACHNYMKKLKDAAIIRVRRSARFLEPLNEMEHPA
jgi:hypothetical protein